MKVPPRIRLALAVVFAAVLALWWGRSVSLRPGHTQGLAARDGARAAATPVSELGGTAPPIAGRVLDSKGRPVAAHVRLRPLGTASTAHWDVDTDAGGAFTLSAVAPAAYLVWAWSDSGEQLRQELALGGANAALTLRLQVAGSVATGFVRDAAGGVIVGAEVSLTSGTAGALPVAFATSDRDGRYRLQAPEGSYFAQASMAGYATTRAVLAMHHEGATLDFQLLPAASLSGLALTASGEPIAGARLRLTAARLASVGRLSHVEAESDATGAFSLSDLEPGSYLLVGSKNELVAQLGPIDLASGESRADVQLVLTTGFNVSGELRDTSGAPVSGVGVDVEQDDSGTGTRQSSTRSDAQGHFHLAGLMPQATTLLVDDPGYVRQTLALGRLTGDAHVTLSLAGASAIRGRVVTRAKEPVVGASVWASVAGDRLARLGPATTDERGEFTLRVGELSSGRSVKVNARHENFGLGDAVLRDVADAAVIELGGGYFVEGDVVDDRSTPVPFARLRAGMTLPGAAPDMLALADAQGHFRVGPLPSGTAALRLEAPLSPPAGAPAALSVELADRDVRGVELRSATRDARLEGRVLDDQGQPIDGAIVTVAPERYGIANRDSGSPTLSGVDGAFVAERLSPGPQRLFVDAKGYAPARVAASAPSRVEIRLQRPGALRGDVTDQAGKPIAAATLQLSQSVGDELERVGRVFASAADGTFSVDGLEPGPYQLTATSRDGRARHQRTLDVAAGETTNLHVELTGGVSVRGRVVAFEDSRGLAGVRVSVSGDAGAATAITSGDGSFEAVGVPRQESLRIDVDGSSQLSEQYVLSALGSNEVVDVGTLRLLTKAEPVGLAAEGVTLSVSPQRAVVTDVLPDTVAATAGLRQGMIVTSIRGKPCAGLGSTGITTLLAAGAPFSVDVPAEAGGGSRELTLQAKLARE